MPAAAVIPAPIAYIKVVAVKKLVVGFVVCPAGLRALPLVTVRVCLFWVDCVALGCRAGDAASFTVKKLECSKQALLPLNILAWNNDIGPWYYFVGFALR